MYILPTLVSALNIFGLRKGNQEYTSTLTNTMLHTLTGKKIFSLLFFARSLHLDTAYVCLMEVQYIVYRNELFAKVHEQIHGNLWSCSVVWLKQSIIINYHEPQYWARTSIIIMPLIPAAKRLIYDRHSIFKTWAITRTWKSQHSLN